ncbi:hypothetical protein E2562_003664 [Oryza meyeriana var. granulata]|uniref:Uncharacterized protein n=1 Tax=Oryza meyeriana var. granulata TaxID=110450 RepID=A0A6G1C3L5_9ORYZ|nr:hypothetical protein E2562_003664 [Oryza meyeriana var. granulata]
MECRQGDGCCSTCSGDVAAGEGEEFTGGKSIDVTVIKSLNKVPMHVHGLGTAWEAKVPLDLKDHVADGR